MSGKTRRQRVGPYDYKLAYFAGVCAGRDDKPRETSHYGEERKQWLAGYDEAKRRLGK